jgi:hypothetical protein
MMSDMLEFFITNRSCYIGKRFRYYSKYGGVTEDIVCKNFAIIHRMSRGDNSLTITRFDATSLNISEMSLDIEVISDKGNAYDIKDIEFYTEL